MKYSKLFWAALVLAANISAANATDKIITFRHEVPEQDRIASIEDAGGKVIRTLHIIDAVAASFPDAVKDAEIFSLRGVTTIEEDKVFKWIEEMPEALPLSYVETSLKQLKSGGYQNSTHITVPAISEENAEIPWGVKRVNAAGAWNTTMGNGVKVAIVDTGVDYNHPDIAAHYAGGYNAIVPSMTPLDDHGHGTHVAGTIGAIKDDKGVVGVAPNVQIYGVKVLNAQGSGSYSSIVAGIQWAADNDMDVINMSLGGGSGTEALKKVMEAADKAGVTIVCAAGNDSGPVNYPAKYPQAIAVSAMDSADKIASFSSRGPEIAFTAPGVNIYSTFKGSAYKTSSGTSMASPHVAGLAALAVALGADTPAKVKTALKNAAVSVNLKPTEEGAGLINAGKLIAALR